MVSQKIKPQNKEETIVWYGILGVFPCYTVGALYLAGPIIAWLLFIVWLQRMLTSLKTSKPTMVFPSVHFVWVLGMLLMLLSLIVGHLNADLATTQIIKSSIGWAKGWALFAVFLITGLLSIRFELIVRACMVLSLHMLLLIPIFVLAWLVGAPQTLYVSPLQIIGGPGPEFFSMSLYEIDPGSGVPRWRLFTPWAPALGMLANFYLIFAFAEKQLFWRRIGFVCAIALVLMSQSRLALVCFILIIGLALQNRYFKGHKLFFALALISFAFALFSAEILSAFEHTYTTFREARIDSSRVRETLARIAIERALSEAPVWGHGVIERGPHLVQYMPIGTHHTWYGLLFIKGFVGVLAFLIPMLSSLLYLLIKPLNTALYRAAFLSILILFMYSLGENLEILAYLYWPALIVIGLSHQQQYTTYQTSRLQMAEEKL